MLGYVLSTVLYAQAIRTKETGEKYRLPMHSTAMGGAQRMLPCKTEKKNHHGKKVAIYLPIVGLADI
jgi:hypothetical protein